MFQSGGKEKEEMKEARRRKEYPVHFAARNAEILLLALNINCRNYFSESHGRKMLTLSLISRSLQAEHTTHTFFAILSTSFRPLDSLFLFASSLMHSNIHRINLTPQNTHTHTRKKEQKMPLSYFDPVVNVGSC